MTSRSRPEQGQSPLAIVWPDNPFRNTFCSQRHPTNPDVYCRRMPNHPDDHAAFIHSITTPQSWP